MSTLKTAVLATAFALCAVPGAMAAGSSLQLIIGGEAYDGPPKFEVTFDGKVLTDFHTERTMLERMVAPPDASRSTMEAAVSSQLVSMPSTLIKLVRYLSKG